MENDALFYFRNPKEFLDFIHSHDIDAGWRIYSGRMNSRGNSIRDKSYTHLLREKFMSKGFFRRNVSVAEIVSWLDNFVYMMRILKCIREELGDELYSSIEIFFEYRIKMSKNKRVDYVLKCNDRFLLLEFRTLDSFDKISSTWNKKKLELMINKELIQNYIKDRQILTYAFIGLFEYSDSKVVVKNKDYNNDQARFLSNYIKLFMFDLKE